MAEKKTPESKDCSSIKIRYIFRNDYNPVYANGAYGGITPSGEIVANFYFERHPLPKSEILRPDGHNYEPSDLANSSVRFIDTGVIMSPETARNLAKWLEKQADMALNIDKVDKPQELEEQ